jgi:DNA-binding response OmpR family regulator
MSTAVLLAEPELDTREFLTHHLSNDGFEVVDADPERALEVVEQVRPDLALLPNVELCRRLRGGEAERPWDRAVPVIVLGDERTDSIDRVRALESGADDFLTRPFIYDELLARIQAVLRRVHPAVRDRLAAGGIEVDRRTYRATVNGRRVTLSGREFELLAHLLTDPYRVFTKKELLRDVWGVSANLRTRTVDSHASRLRCKLGEDGAGPFVVTEWGVGYRLLGD